MTSHADWNQGIIDEFRRTGGTVAQFGRSLVLVHHVGAKSGTERVSPVVGIQAGPDTWWIAASKAGADSNPGWYHNLLAHPDTVIEVPGGETVSVDVSELVGAERDAAWAAFTQASPGFASYEEKTTRIIPVLSLNRAASA